MKKGKENQVTEILTISEGEAINHAAHYHPNIKAIVDRLFKVVDVQCPKPPLFKLQNNFFKGRKMFVRDANGIIQKDSEGFEKTEHYQTYEAIDLPDTQLCYNDRGQFLGHVGKNYESIQPEMFLNSLLGTIDGCGKETKLDLSKLEYIESANGRYIQFRLPVKTVAFKNVKGKEDIVDLFLSFNTGFGGYGRTELGLFSKRLICSNGMRIIEAETELKAKHTPRMNQKSLLYCEELVNTVNKVEETTKVWTAMNTKQVNESMIVNFTKKLADIKTSDKISEQSVRKQNIYNLMRDAIAAEFNDTGATVWGLLNGATRYTNHYASGHENSEYILYATGAKTNELAQHLALEMLN